MSDKTLIRLVPSVLLLSGLAALHPAAAQFVTFGPAQTINTYTNVSTTGTLVDAYKFGSVFTSVNGVSFSPVNSISGAGHLSISVPSASTAAFAATFGSTSGTFSNLATVYKTLLTKGLYVSGSDPLSLTESGLTAGHRYQVQYFVNDSRALAVGRTESVTSSGGNSQTLTYNSTGADGGVGQYANGTFTAASGSVTITAASSVSAQINGLQFRDLGNAGAAITFGAPTITRTANGVLNTPVGTVIYAAAFGAGTQTVTTGGAGAQTITFVDGTDAKATVVGGYGIASTGAFTSTATSTGNAAFNTVLGGFNYDTLAGTSGTNGTSGTKQITLSGLTAGKQYSVQLFGLDDRSGSNTRTFSFSDFSGNSSGLITNGQNRNVVGTFTAASAFQTITESIPSGGNINALVVRDLSGVSAAPEPSQIASLALAALGMLGVVLKARKRKTSMELN